MAWISGTKYDIADRHAAVLINDFTSTKRFVCWECSVKMPEERIAYPDNGIDWPCDEAQRLIDAEEWDAILWGIRAHRFD
jgi:hypothetical protein